MRKVIVSEFLSLDESCKPGKPTGGRALDDRL
jgi:hypothetical protein